MALDKIQRDLLAEIADLHGVPEGAYNIRSDGKLEGRNTTANIDIVTKSDKPGIDIYVKPGTKNESVHIPVIIEQSGLKDLVYNDFHIGEGADVTIIAGCGINNCGSQDSQHDGIHSFFLAKNARLKYVEKHYADGDGTGGRIMNPTTIIELGEGAYMEMDTTQIKGIDSTKRETTAKLGAGATLIVREKLMTHGTQTSDSEFTIDLDGDDSSANIISRGVARDSSRQILLLRNKRQRPLLRPQRVRQHSHGQLLRPGDTRDYRQQRGGQPCPRGRHRQDCRRPDYEADDPRAHGARGRGADSGRIPEMIRMGQEKLHR